MQNRTANSNSKHLRNQREHSCTTSLHAVELIHRTPNPMCLHRVCQQLALLVQNTNPQPPRPTTRIAPATPAYRWGITAAFKL